MKSMTGFGRCEGKVGNHSFTVELKSVNHRYIDARFRLPPSFSPYEMPLGEMLRSKFERGAFEIAIRQKVSSDGGATFGATRFVVDELAAQSLLEACAWLHKKYKTEKLPSLDVLAFTNKVFIPVDDTGDPEGAFEELRDLFRRALEELDEMRSREGVRLKTILKDSIDGLSRTSDKLRKLAPEQSPKILEKLRQRIAQWKLGEVDSQRLEWELAFYAERSEITEELDRLKAHVEEFGELLESKRSVGRRLDFLTQEMHREVNTMGAKACLLTITQAIVEAKALIEKLREQVQNVE
jgi:uncharacterized protein (TIGR00255 family)